MTTPRRSAATTFVALVLAGVVGGVVWRLVWTPDVYVVSDGAAGLGEVELARTFTSDAWYLVVAAPLGLLVGLARRRTSRPSGMLDLLAAVVGSAVAAYVMLGVGRLLGPSVLSPAELSGVADGTRLDGPLQLATAVSSEGLGSIVFVVMLAWPLGVLAGWVAELIIPSLEPREVRERRQVGAPGSADHDQSGALS
ncbi:hypothetical protein KLP28_02135 [Nocardioidaceae bacterium]|nr:hypothetical protein KLP28_02135 [Nocardioidaceae bacterium]